MNKQEKYEELIQLLCDFAILNKITKNDIDQENRVIIKDAAMKDEVTPELRERFIAVFQSSTYDFNSTVKVLCFCDLF
jgi:hypothetical protein